MDVFIYASPGFGCPRDEIEDAIETFLGYRGEVAGGGTGEKGSNIDVELFEVGNEPVDPRWVVDGLRDILKRFKCPQDSVIVIDKLKYSVYAKD